MAGGARSAAFGQSPTECADGSMTLWMHNNDGKNPCELVQDVLRRGYTCDNAPGSTLSPCCCGSPTFALMSACWSCQYNITFDLVSTTFTGFVKDCQTLPNPITSYDPSVRSRILALDLPPWSEVEPLAGKWDFAGAWRNSTPSPTAAPPVPTGYPIQVNSTGISKGALAGAIVGAILGSKILFMLAGYLFYRWWKKQPGRDDDDDEKGYVHHAPVRMSTSMRAPTLNLVGAAYPLTFNQDRFILSLQRGPTPRFLGSKGLTRRAHPLGLLPVARTT
ncbi:hypothetical protein BN14_11941 [Rhizoctonia solani AG-1 IB]|uniref:Transmembrane protein n=1 Tax=Thanatephorus cucumeris (strain AG1-IB / isolate 7/3/14) TaxID=1108050 RepID=M5CED4_THACB|nr:hypothetical protein BN14_11941 [Rhizoctonia solani AG-1 IB]